MKPGYNGSPSEGSTSNSPPISEIIIPVIIYIDRFFCSATVVVLIYRIKIYRAVIDKMKVKEICTGATGPKIGAYPYGLICMPLKSKPVGMRAV
jgi:hypothetical protein